MKLGWVSVGINARTGYGRMSREICERLVERYDDLLYLGNEADILVWGAAKPFETRSGKSIKTVNFTNPLGNRTEATGIVKSFVAENKVEYLIAHWDVWVLPFLRDVNVPYAIYIPIDAELTQKWVNYMDGAHKVIAFSLFGYEQLKRFFHPSRIAYIPHGVSTDIFRPVDLPRSARTKLPTLGTVPEDCFLFVSTQANVGERKHMPLLLRTFKKFADGHPDAHFYMHTNALSEVPWGFDLPALVEQLGLSGRVHWPKFNPIVEPATDEELNVLYNLGDAYLTNSVGEGFGLPVLEAMAAGLPVIAPDNSSHRELVKGHGWLVKSIDPDEYVNYPGYVPTLQSFPVPNQRDLLNCMEEAYYDGKKRKQYSRDARIFAQDYDWSQIMPRWFRLLEEVEEERKLFAQARVALKPVPP